MKLVIIILLSISTYSMAYNKENAAPSIHITNSFSSPDAILKMQKVKIVQSAFASYFEVNSFTNGYAGLQQTADKSYGSSNIFISSLWDPNTASGIYSTVDYCNPKTLKKRFGGEGDGWKTINFYNWKLDIWYNIVNRCWKLNGRLYIATFINDLSTGKWIHMTTCSIPDPNKFLSATNDAFLENWDGKNSSQNGSFIRKAYFKDCWNLNLKGNWEKPTRVTFSANNSAADITRNGIYHNSFDAFYDSTQDAYCMQHGGGTKPSMAFNGGRILGLPLQVKQEDLPKLTTAVVTSINVNYDAGCTKVFWTIDEYKSPQLTAKIEILNAAGTVVGQREETQPNTRSAIIKGNLPYGKYKIRVIILDIFNQLSNDVTQDLILDK